MTPDVLTFAKGLAAGLPIGAVVATAEITGTHRHRRPRQHLRRRTGALRGGPGQHRRHRARGPDRERRRRSARDLAAGARALGVRRVSGRGLLLGLHLGRPAAEVQQALFEHRILTGTASDPAGAPAAAAALLLRQRGRPAARRTQGRARVTKRDFLALEDWSPAEIEAARAGRADQAGRDHAAGWRGRCWRWSSWTRACAPAPASRPRCSCTAATPWCWSRARAAGRSRPSPAR